MGGKNTARTPNSFRHGSVLTGTVTGRNRRPVPQAHLFLAFSPSSSSPPAHQISDESGHYRFTGISPGHYTLLVVYHGYLIRRVPVIVTHTGSKITLDLLTA